MHTALVMAPALLVLSLAPAPEPVRALPTAANGTVHEIAPPHSGRWCVAIVSDVQQGFPYLPALLERARAQGALAVLLMGDLATSPGWDHLQLPVREVRMAGLDVPVFSVPGNHDHYGDEGLHEFAVTFGGLEFDVRIGGVRLIGMDNSYYHPITDAALAGLKRAFADAAARGEKVVLCAHRDWIDWAGKTRSGSEREHRRVLALMRAWSVNMAFCGHYHEPHHEQRGPTRFVVVPASGDRHHGEQTPVTLTILEQRDGELLVRHEWLYRDSVSELKGALLHFTLAHSGAWIMAGGWVVLAACFLLGRAVLRGRAGLPAP